MKTKLLTICLLLFTSQVFAGWTQVAKNVDGTIFYLDLDRTKEHNGYMYYYMLGDYLTPKVGDLSVQYYRQVDCKSNRYREISFIFYKQSMGKGTGDVDNKIGDWETASSNLNTINNTVHKIICNR